VTFLRTVEVGSPDLESLTPLSGGGSGPSWVLFFVIISPRSGGSDEELLSSGLFLGFGSFMPTFEASSETLLH